MYIQLRCRVSATLNANTNLWNFRSDVSFAHISPLDFSRMARKFAHSRGLLRQKRAPAALLSQSVIARALRVEKTRTSPVRKRVVAGVTRMGTTWRRALPSTQVRVDHLLTTLTARKMVMAAGVMTISRTRTRIRTTTAEGRDGSTLATTMAIRTRFQVGTTAIRITPTKIVHGATAHPHKTTHGQPQLQPQQQEHPSLLPPTTAEPPPLKKPQTPTPTSNPTSAAGAAPPPPKTPTKPNVPTANPANRTPTQQAPPLTSPPRKSATARTAYATGVAPITRTTRCVRGIWTLWMSLSRCLFSITGVWRNWRRFWEGM